MVSNICWFKKYRCKKFNVKDLKKFLCLLRYYWRYYFKVYGLIKNIWLLEQEEEMINIKFKEWFKDIVEEFEKEGNYFYYNMYIIENFKWVFGDQIIFIIGFMIFILYDDIWVFDLEDFEDLKIRFKVLIEVKNIDFDIIRNEDKFKVEVMIIEIL